MDDAAYRKQRLLQVVLAVLVLPGLGVGSQESGLKPAVSGLRTKLHAQVVATEAQPAFGFGACVAVEVDF
jgi:hypothetical protein